MKLELIHVSDGGAMSTGWICPKCCKVWAPHVSFCYDCSARGQVTITSWPPNTTGTPLVPPLPFMSGVASGPGTVVVETAGGSTLATIDELARLRAEDELLNQADEVDEPKP